MYKTGFAPNTWQEDGQTLNDEFFQVLKGLMDANAHCYCGTVSCMMYYSSGWHYSGSSPDYRTSSPEYWDLERAMDEGDLEEAVVDLMVDACHLLNGSNYRYSVDPRPELTAKIMSSVRALFDWCCGKHSFVELFCKAFSNFILLDAENLKSEYPFAREWLRYETFLSTYPLMSDARVECISWAYLPHNGEYLDERILSAQLDMLLFCGKADLPFEEIHAQMQQLRETVEHYRTDQKMEWYASICASLYETLLKRGKAKMEHVEQLTEWMLYFRAQKTDYSCIADLHSIRWRIEGALKAN